MNYYNFIDDGTYLSKEIVTQLDPEKTNLTTTTEPPDEDKNHPWYGKSLNLLDYIQPDSDTTIISNKEICVPIPSYLPKKRSSPYLLITIISAPGNFEQRQAIRDTWLSMDNTNWTIPFNFRAIFVMGKTMNESIQAEIFAESATHQDIFQEGGFIDAYLNL